MTTEFITFSHWLDSILSNCPPDEIVAFNFNLYECMEDGQFDIQLIGSAYYSDTNTDWACGTVFSSGENVFPIESEDWEKCLEKCEKLISEYIQHGEYAQILMYKKAVTVGFVDGDLNVVYKSKV